MIKYDRIFLLFFVSPFLVASVLGLVQIKELRMPTSVRSGEVDELILDCDYEVRNVSGIEVKWFYNGNKDQIYQWIPGRSAPGYPMGSLKNNIDATFQATDDKLTMYRALKLINVTHNLTGSYTCKVSGYTEEAVETKNLTIFVPAPDGLNLTIIPEEMSAICSVSGIFPEPMLSLIIQNGNITNSTDYRVENDVEKEHGLYNKVTTLYFKNESMAANSEFICMMKIPGTEYEITETRLYSTDNFSIRAHLDISLLPLCILIMFLL